MRKFYFLFAFALLFFATTSFAQTDPEVFFLARSDTNGSGSIDAGDNIGLYRQILNQSVRFTPETMTVLAYTVDDANSEIVYVGEELQSMTVSRVGLDGTPIGVYPVTQVNVVEDVKVGNDTIWVIGLSTTRRPTLVGFSRADGSVITNYSTRSSSSEIELSPDGSYLLAYNLSGAIDAFRLPAVERVSLELSGYLQSAPTWSSNQNQIMLAASPVDNINDYQVWVKNVGDGAFSAIDVAETGAVLQSNTTWSNTGQYIVYAPTIIDDDSNVSRKTLSVVNVSAGTVSEVSDPDFDLSFLGWSFDDSYALVRKFSLSDESAPAQLAVYNATDGSMRTLDLQFAIPESAVWHPELPQFVMLADAGFGTGVTRFDATGTNSAITIVDGASAELAEATLAYDEDGSHIFILASASDPLADLMDVPSRAYRYQVSDGTLVETIVDGLQINPDTLLAK